MDMDKYRDRQEAGKVLADALKSYENHKDTIVLGLARGGIPVAYEVAKGLNLPLDVYIVRKIGVPGHAELALGAIASGGTSVFNDDIIRELQITQDQIQPVITQELAELERREKVYRQGRPLLDLKDKTVILVDDGVATGATMLVAIKAIRHLFPRKLIVAVPVAQATLCQKMQTYVDEFVCPLCPENLYAVGAWYDDFSQTEDDEVRALLNEVNSNKGL